MPDAALISLLFFLLVSFILLFVTNISRKLYTDYNEKHNRKIRENIKIQIDGFAAGTEQEFNEGLAGFVQGVRSKDRNYRALVDEYLLEILERPAAEHGERYNRIAGQLDFPSDCIAQIRSRNHRISALGSRRAGLYNVYEAVKDMEAALDFFSSENQFEILMSLARMGRADAMQKAFERIKNNILINERGVNEILSSFPGGKEKTELFRRMIHGDTHYITALFLKALNREMAEVLMDDIVEVLQKGNKEIRAAAVRGLSTLGSEAPAKTLVRALEDKDWEVRALAAKALGQIRTPEASMTLFKALYDQQWWVRQNAANALTGHPGYESLFVLAAESGDEYAKDTVIGALENGSSPVMIRSLKVMVT